MNSCDIFRQLINRKDLLAYADDITMFTKNDVEINLIVKGFRQIENQYNLKINLKKCEILRIKGGSKSVQQIEGIEVKDSVRYLGLKLVIDRGQQRKEVEK